MILTINGHAVEIQAEPATPLIDVLRNELGLTGTRYGCGLEQCGSCLVLEGGAPVHACTREVGHVGGDIVTVEGLAGDRLIEAFLAEQAGQCGYCLSGMIIAAKALLMRHPHPTREQIVAALDNNLCRCGTHHRILRAVVRAAGIAA
jgi:nicotinate dehydrogenase subunit A